TAGGRVLVIGYGNTLRTDDGVGRRVAMAVASWELPGMRSIAVHQLTPELAEPLANAELAIFVDARFADGEETVEVHRLEPSASRGGLGHVSDPRSLLALARAIYGGSPRTWLVMVPAADLSLGEGLSSTAARGAEVALARIATLIEAEGHRCLGSDSGSSDDGPGRFQYGQSLAGSL
ncbi:MAG TPA: hydrogenase maturation protease, partial [Isosphaeraceae bacterium]|nr:hydrogenase maturation protease [Isosphaeraceae bacterium]